MDWTLDDVAAVEAQVRAACPAAVVERDGLSLRFRNPTHPRGIWWIAFRGPESRLPPHRCDPRNVIALVNTPADRLE
jgi:hypothetical protein